MKKTKQKRVNRAKSLVAQPIFRTRLVPSKKGKGSYRRNKKGTGA